MSRVDDAFIVPIVLKVRHATLANVYSLALAPQPRASTRPTTQPCRELRPLLCRRRVRALCAGRQVWKEEPGTPTELACAVLVALVLLPLQLVSALVGIDQNVLALVDELDETATEVGAPHCRFTSDTTTSVWAPRTVGPRARRDTRAPPPALRWRPTPRAATRPRS